MLQGQPLSPYSLRGLESICQKAGVQRAILSEQLALQTETRQVGLGKVVSVSLFLPLTDKN